MVTHVVIFTWIAEATEAQISALGEAMTQLGNELSERVTHRTDLLAFSEIDCPWGGGLSCVGAGRISSI